MTIARMIPPALAGRANWMGTEPDSKGDWKNPSSLRPGFNGQWKTEAAYSDFPDAFDALQSGKTQQVGFVFRKDLGWICIDLDHVRDPETGQVAKWAQRVIDSFKGIAYIEISLSGRGFHIIFVGRKLGWMASTTETVADPEPGSKIECFDEKFVVLTGNTIEGSIREFGDGQDVFERVYAKFFPKDIPGNRRSGDKAETGSVEPVEVDTDIIESFTETLRSESPSFCQLFDDGDLSQFDDDDSRADQSICSRVASVTKGMPIGERWTIIDAVWRQSSHCRKRPNPQKLDRADYRQRTIEKALSNGQYGGSDKPTGDDISISNSVSLRPGTARKTASGKITITVTIIVDGDPVDRIDITSSQSGRSQAEKSIRSYAPEVDGVKISQTIGKMLVDAENRLRTKPGTSEPTVRDIVSKNVPEVFRLEYRTERGVWSEKRRCEIQRPEFITFTPGWLVDQCAAASDAPRNEAGVLNDPALLRSIEAALKVLWATIVCKLPVAEAEAELTEDSEAAQKFRGAIVHLWTTMTTFEVTTVTSGDLEEKRAARASLASRILSQVANPDIRSSQLRGGWYPVQSGFHAWWRETGDSKSPIILAMRFTLSGQLRIDIPGATDQTSLTKLGRQYGALSDTGSVSYRLNDGSRLFVVSDTLTREILAEPSWCTEQTPVNDTNDTTFVSDRE